MDWRNRPALFAINPYRAMKDCIHCGTPFEPTALQPSFCCAGCQFVYDLIHKQGLDRFYDLRNNSLQPVKTVVFQKRDYSWLEELRKTAEAQENAPKAARLRLDLQGVSCIGCIWLIEKLFTATPGSLSIDIDPVLGTMELRWTKQEFDLLSFAQRLQSFGYLVGPAGTKSAPHTKALTKRMGVCAAFAMNAMLFTLPHYLGMQRDFAYAYLFDRLSLLFATLSFFFGGSYFFVRSLQSLRRGVLHIDLPISLGLIAAYSGSLYAYSANAMEFVYFDFVSTFVFLMLVGRWLQQSAVEKNRNRLLGLNNTPQIVTRVEGGARLPASAITQGLSYRIPPGGIIPVRSQLLTAAATIGLEWINGEADARSAKAGQLLPSGAVNYTATQIELKATEEWGSSILATLTHVGPRNMRQPGLERFLKIYILCVLAVALAGFSGWYLSTNNLLASLQVLTSILVVSCPCAAGLAIPMADELATAAARKRGVFVREQSLWNRIKRIRKILFDKTGTLTLESMALSNPEALTSLAPEHREALLTLVKDNPHPVSTALRELLLAAGTPQNDQHVTIEEIVGVGLLWHSPRGVYRLGRPDWAANSPGQDCAFTLEEEALARFTFVDEVRPDAQKELQLLQRSGASIHILSGDRPEKVQAMAARLNLKASNCHGGLTPDQKAQAVRQLDRRDTLMIGDGANDSLAFNESLCTGTPAIDRGLLEHKADFYFLGRGIGGVRCLLQTATRHQKAVRSVVLFTTAYNLITITLSLMGKMNPLAAAVLMPASSILSLAIVLLLLPARR